MIFQSGSSCHYFCLMQEVGKTRSLTHLIIPGETSLLMKKCPFKIQNRDVMVLFMLLTLKKKETFFFLGNINSRQQLNYIK